MNENLRRTILGLSKAQRDALYAKIKASSSAHSVANENETMLAAWIVPNDEAVVDVTELRAFLGERLPTSMVPETIFLQKELPLTASGKVNHRALRDVLSASVMPQDETMLRTPVEALLGSIWCEVMGLTRVGRH